MQIYSETFRTRESDFDVNGNIKPSAVLDFFQEIAGTHANLLGLGFDDLIENDLLWAIVKVKFESYWNYIQNGYQYPDWCKKGLQLGRCSFEYLLSEINNDNSKLICWPDSPTITFTSSPTTPGEYTFTMELTTNGETFTTTFTKKFE